MVVGKSLSFVQDLCNASEDILSMEATSEEARSSGVNCGMNDAELSTVDPVQSRRRATVDTRGRSFPCREDDAE